VRRTFAILALLVVVATSAQAQRSWQSEIGIQGGYTRVVAAGSGGSPTDVFSLPGFNLGPAAPLPPAVYAILPWKNKIAIEPELAFSQVFVGIATQATAIQLGVRGDYAVSRDFYAAAGGALGYIHNAGLKETQLGLQAALGYHRHLTGPLNMRLEARFTAWGKTNNVSPFDVYSGLIGISTATRAAAPRSGRAAPSARGAWSKRLGVAGGYADIHSVGGGADFVAFALPGYGGGFAGLGVAGLNLPPTIFAIIPIGSKIAIEPGLDIHRAQAGGTTNFNGNFSARLDYAVSGGWYAGLGGNLNYIKSTGVNAATRTGLNLGWGYRFGFLGPLGGRVETSYTLWGKNTDLALPPQNVFAVMFGVTMPLK
jgi:hypothetical protein